MKIVEKSIILTFDELRILLYSRGERKCEGVYMPKKIYSSENIINALDVMSKNGLLVLDKDGVREDALPAVFIDEESSEHGNADSHAEEQFCIRDDLLGMLEIIANHNAAEIIEVGEGRRLFCYYSDRGVLTSEKYSKRKDAVRLTEYTVDGFERFRESLEEESEWSLLQ